MNFGQTLIADLQTPKLVQPSQSALHNPARFAQAAAVRPTFEGSGCECRVQQAPGDVLESRRPDRPEHSAVDSVGALACRARAECLQPMAAAA